MSRFPIPRGTARAIRRGNTAPSLGFEPVDMREEFTRSETLIEWCESADSLERYRDLRDEGYSYTQAMLMSGRGDPDSLGCT